jgi:hypothetical protein
VALKSVSTVLNLRKDDAHAQTPGSQSSDEIAGPFGITAKPVHLDISIYAGFNFP